MSQKVKNRENKKRAKRNRKRAARYDDRALRADSGTRTPARGGYMTKG